MYRYRAISLFYGIWQIDDSYSPYHKKRIRFEDYAPSNILKPKITACLIKWSLREEKRLKLQPL